MYSPSDFTPEMSFRTKPKTRLARPEAGPALRCVLQGIRALVQGGRGDLSRRRCEPALARGSGTGLERAFGSLVHHSLASAPS